MKNKTIIKFNKLFARGKQYIYLNEITEDIVEVGKEYYWQERLVFNRILPIVEYFNHRFDLTDNDIYGRYGLVDCLVPCQRAYNAIKNKKHEFITRITNPICVVEDGSVDIDALEEDGLSSGKVLVYRQGANKPELLIQETLVLNNIEVEERRIIEEINNIVDGFNIRFSSKLKKEK